MSISTTCDIDHSNKSLHRKYKSLHFKKHQDPLITNKPFETRTHGHQFEQNFCDYLKGDLNVSSLIQTLNCPRLTAERQIPHKERLSLKIRQQTEQRRNYLKGKIQKVRNLIKEKVAIKKPHNEEIRQGNAQTLTIVQTILDIANHKENAISYQEKLMPKSKSLKHYRLNYDNVEPICKIQRDFIETIPPRQYLKSVLENNAQLYLQELQLRAQQHQNNINKLVRLSIQNKRKDFTLFHKAAKTDRRNQDGILTIGDVQLYDYLYNTPKGVMIEKNPKYIQNVIDSGVDFRKNLGRRLLGNRHQKTHYNQDPPDNLDDSCASSLQSACEIKLDNYYGETREWKHKQFLQLPRRIKQLIALEELNQYLIFYHLGKPFTQQLISYNLNDYIHENNYNLILQPFNNIIINLVFYQCEPSHFHNVNNFRNNNQSQRLDNTLSKVPSFENLYARIRDHSYPYSYLSNVLNNSTIEPTYSLHKAQGLSSKINATLEPKKIYINQKVSFQSSQIFNQSPPKYGQSLSQIKNLVQKYNQTNNLIDLILLERDLNIIRINKITIYLMLFNQMKLQLLEIKLNHQI
ncbi:unnamed protein product [Paramecium sonneborni]|uniref:Uncharacterized protein n=1 Tax=Paramecium sonneborni TaxID=65129 RepID=A0A8S1M754_9CILI|nr:unnamed protein product [Paramecium sonneborni]